MLPVAERGGQAVSRDVSQLTPTQEAAGAQKTASTGEAVKADTSLFDKVILQNFNQARKSFIEFAKNHFPSEVVNTETGKKIGISRKGLDKFLSGNILYEKYASGFHIPELIERAHRVTQAPNDNHRGTADSIPTYEYFDSPIEIDGKQYNAHIRVKNTLMGDKYYGHTISEIDDIQIENPTRTSASTMPAVQPENTGFSSSIISALGDGVNTEYAQGSENNINKVRQIIERDISAGRGRGDLTQIYKEVSGLFGEDIRGKYILDMLLRSEYDADGGDVYRKATAQQETAAVEPGEVVEDRTPGEFVDDRTPAETAMWEEHQAQKREGTGTGSEYYMTEAVKKLGMEAPTRPITDLSAAESLRGTSKALFEAKRALDKVLKEIDADEGAKRMAQGIVDGTYTMRQAVRAGYDARAMADIVDAMRLVRSYDARSIKAHQERTNWVFDGKVKELTKDSGVWKTPSVLSLNTNTMQRNMERMMGAEAAKEFNAEFFDPVIENEAKRIRFVNSQLEKVAGFKLTTQESAVVQELMEGKITEGDLTKRGFDTRRLSAAAKTISQMYGTFYDAINDFLVTHGYQEIGWQKNYAPHMQEENMGKLQTCLQRLGFQTEVFELPTELAGRTDTFRPGKQFDPYFQHRHNGGEIKYDAVGGLESYINYLSNVFYHTDDIQKLRRLSEGLRYQYADDYIRGEIDRLNDLQDQIMDGTADGSQWDAAQAAKDKLYEDLDKRTKLGGFVSVLDDYTNILAGKQSKLDRSIESALGREKLNWGRNIQNAFARSAVVGNLSSAINQTVQLPQLTAEVGPKNVVQAVRDVLTGETRKGEFEKLSTFLTGKRGIQGISEVSGMDKLNGVLSIPFELVDDFASRIIVRAKYLQEVSRGADASTALKAADAYANRLVGSRMKGAKPIVFEWKNPVAKLVTTFQLEVANGFEHIVHDLPVAIQETARTQGKYAAIRQMVGLLVGSELAAFLGNLIIKAITGQEPVPFDGVGLAMNFMASGYGMTKEDYMKAAVDNVAETFTGDRPLGTGRTGGEFDMGEAIDTAKEGVMEGVPYLSNITTMMGYTDGRLPLPQLTNTNLKKAGKDVGTVLSGEIDPEERKEALSRLPGEAGLGAAELVAGFLPAGNQIKKTVKFLPVLAQGGAYTGQGEDKKLQYPVELSPQNILRGFAFGKSALPETDAYYAEGKTALTVKQTAAYESIVAQGGDRQATYDLIQKLRGVKGDGTSLSASRNKKAIMDTEGAWLTRAQREALYIAFGVSEKVWNEPAGLPVAPRK